MMTGGVEARSFASHHQNLYTLWRIVRLVASRATWCPLASPNPRWPAVRSVIIFRRSQAAIMRFLVWSVSSLLVWLATAQPLGSDSAHDVLAKRSDGDIPGATYLEPALVDSASLALTFTEHLLLVKSRPCADACVPLETKISQCNTTAVTDNELSSCLCGGIGLVESCTRCIANGTLDGRGNQQSESVRDAAAIVLYQDVFHACAAAKLIRLTATEVRCR